MTLDDIAGRLPRREAEKMFELIGALKWVEEVYPGRDRDGGAVIHMTWEEWGKLRSVLGLYEQPKPTRVTSTRRLK
jgi:hypothetical protein